MKIRDISARELRFIRPMHSLHSSRLRLFFLACFLGATSLLSWPAQATIMQFLDIEELTRLSSDVFQGQVTSVSVGWNAERTRIYTRALVRVEETFKGRPRRSEVVAITQLGGEVDGVRMDYAGRPQFNAGESVALFTVRGRNNDFIVVGLKQGKLRVEGVEVVRDFSGITLIDRRGPAGNERTLTTRPIRLSLTDLRNRIQRTR